MITCNECGKLHEGKEIGSSWICEDCNYDPKLDPPSEKALHHDSMKK